MKTLCKRLVSMLLVFVLVLGLMPSVYAATDEGTTPATEPATVETTVPTETAPDETSPATEATEATDATDAPEPSSEPDQGQGQDAMQLYETANLDNAPLLMAASDDGIMLAASTQSSIMLFDYNDNGNYTSSLNSQITVKYKWNGTGSSLYCYLKNFGWHFARYGNVPYADEPLYCIEPHKDFGASTSGNSVDRDVTLSGSGSTTGSNVWYSLNANRRKAIGLILLYTDELWDHSISVSTTSKSNNPNVPLRMAAQFLIFEIVCGLRDPDTFVLNSSNECGTEGDIFYNAGTEAISYFAPNYNNLVSYVKAALQIPSFTSSSSSTAPVIEMDSEEISVYDSNKVLSDFSFTDKGGVEFYKSGYTLYLTQTGTINENTVHTATKYVPSPDDTTYNIWYMSGSSYQTTISLYNAEYGNLNAYFKVKGPSLGEINLTKTTEDGLNLSGWQFGIYSDYACSNLVSGPHTTNANGQISVTGITPGTYYVKEIGHTNSSINSQYVCSSTNPQQVTISVGTTATVSFTNKIKTGNFSLVKTTEDYNNLAGWQFGIYSDPNCNSLVSDPHTTGTGGRISVTGLPIGTYYVKEIGHTDDAVEGQYVCTTENPQKVTITYGGTASVSFHNDLIPGAVRIVKETNTNSDLAGWKFNVYTDASCTNLLTGSPFTTGADGVIVADVEAGTYYIKEVDESSSKPTWTFDTTLKTVVVPAGGTGTVTFTNTHYGYGRIVKQTNTGENLGGWKFNLYTDQACSQIVSGSPFTSAEDGTVEVRLLPGTYYVREVDVSSSQPDWDLDTETKKLTVEAGKTTSVTFTNIHYGYAKIIKETSTGTDLGGWKFNIFADETCTTLITGSPFVSAEDGAITVRIEPGTYYVQEIDESDKKPGWAFDTTVREVKVEAGKTVSVTIVNTRGGYVQIQKKTNVDGNLSGWKFNIYTDKECTNLVTGSPFTSDETGMITAKLEPGTFYVREIDESEDKPYWKFDASVQEVTVETGKTATVTFENIQQGRMKLIKSMPDGGSVAGWEFDVYLASDNTFIGTYISGEDGTILSDYLMPGEYLVSERIDEKSIFWCETENPQTVNIKAGETAEVTFTNRFKPGKIAVQKVEMTGEPLAGAEFLLEWSTDGVNWLPVVRTDSQYVIEGTCNSPGIADGKLVTDETGLVEFTGLHPDRYYRLTETTAPEGFLLLSETAFEGKLPADNELTVELTVVNVRTFQLPETGSKSFVMMSVSLALACGLCAVMLYHGRRKED